MHASLLLLSKMDEHLWGATAAAVFDTLTAASDAPFVPYQETMFGSLFGKLGWAGTGTVLLVATIAILVTAMTASGDPSEVRYSRSNWRPVLLVGLGVLGVVFGLTWSVAKVLPKCTVVEDDVCLYAR